MTEEEYDPLESLKAFAEKIQVPRSWVCQKCGSKSRPSYFNKKLLTLCSKCFFGLIEEFGLQNAIKEYFMVAEEIMKIERTEIELRLKHRNKGIELTQKGDEALNIISEKSNTEIIFKRS